jgi:hypothetical protein
MAVVDASRCIERERVPCCAAEKFAAGQRGPGPAQGSLFGAAVATQW